MAFIRQRLPELGDGDEYEMRSSDALVYNINDEVERKIVGWRVLCFERLGFTATAGLALALRRDIDRERVETELGRGATHEQVAAIFL